MHNVPITTCLVILAFAGGCHARPATVALQGDVTYQGEAVRRGRIDFLPADATPGASAVAPIAAGRYQLPPGGGLLPDGVYVVQITAFRKTGKTEPNRIQHGGPPIEVEENFIPAAYNRQSTLKVRVAELKDRDKVDFHLREAPSR
jgi:hypothetical protein